MNNRRTIEIIEKKEVRNELMFNHAIDYNTNFYTYYRSAIARVLSIANGEHPEWTLSCSRSDQYLGSIGFTCTGTVLEMYDRDCFSVQLPNGGRQANEYYRPYKCDVAKWNSSPYDTEAFIKDIHIVSFWIEEQLLQKCYNNESIMKEIKKLYECNLPFVVLK